MATPKEARKKAPELVRMVEPSGFKYYARSYDDAGVAKLVELTASTDVVYPDRKRPRLTVEGGKPEGDEGNLSLLNHVPQNLIDKINNNQYVELESLMEEKKMACEPAKTLQVNEKGEIVTAKEKSPSMIDCWCWFKWVKAYTVFAAIYGGNTPDASAGLWQHFYTITKVADRYEWEAYNYDIKYHMARVREANPVWGKKDQNLWSEEVQSHKVYDSNYLFLVPRASQKPQHNNKATNNNKNCPIKG